MDEALVHLGCDAQTSGGLLIAVPPERLDQLQRALAARGVEGRVIGQFVAPSSGRILLTNSASATRRGQASPPASLHPSPTDDNVRAPSPMNSSSTPPAPHDPNCCADLFAANTMATNSSAEAQKAFGAMMRAAQGPGVLNEKAKELILFSLVLHSRCHPCFDAHYEKARALGITQAELDEAAWCAIAMGGAPVRMFYQDCLRRAQSPAAASSK